jgi:hypothetical protein
MRVALSDSIYKYLHTPQIAIFIWIFNAGIKINEPVLLVDDKMLVNPKTYIFAPL